MEDENENSQKQILDDETLKDYRKRELEDIDAKRDAHLKMAWYALYGMVFYPIAVIGTMIFGLDDAAKVLGDMAGPYFISTAGIVAAFMGFSKKK